MYDKMFHFEEPIYRLHWRCDEDLYKSLYSTHMVFYYNNTFSSVMHDQSISKVQLLSDYANRDHHTYISVGVRPYNLLVLQASSLWTQFKQLFQTKVYYYEQYINFPTAIPSVEHML